VTARSGIELAGVVKRYGAERPLRIAKLAVGPHDHLALGGFSSAAAEVFVNLITGAALPEQGDVRVNGRSTRDIATDTEWLASLDRFGIVTERAVLLENMSVAANMALPFTVSIDPIPDDVHAQVEALADEVGLSRERLTGPASAMTPEERVRVHLARALGPNPQILLLEHPTAHLDPAAAESFGATLKMLSAARAIGWVALTDDRPFARAAGATWLQLDAGTGTIRPEGFWRRMLS
jgi:ABC-type transporter Mla maintaining outer membrane lipid asymmetry ATPase subunit MlaF